MPKKGGNTDFRLSFYLKGQAFFIVLDNKNK